MRGKRVVYRCSKGHLFTLYWWWPILGGITVIRLGFGGYMRCPVGNHWALVKTYKTQLTEEERQTLKQRERHDDRAVTTLSISVGVLLGLGSLVGSIFEQSWWLAGGFGLWVAVFGVALIRARRRGQRCVSPISPRPRERRRPRAPRPSSP